jgi:hypothetical protein
MTLMMIIWMVVSMTGVREDGVDDWVEKDLGDDVSGYRDRIDEDGLGNYYLWLR